MAQKRRTLKKVPKKNQKKVRGGTSQPTTVSAGPVEINFVNPRPTVGTSTIPSP